MFGKAGCLSASFWWPWLVDESKTTFLPQYEFLNSTIAGIEKDPMKPRLRQKILIDVGTMEDAEVARVRWDCQCLSLPLGNFSKAQFR